MASSDARFMIPQPQPTGETALQNDHQMALYLDDMGNKLKWSAPFPLPSLFERVYVTMNGLGWALVVGYFSEGGYVGVMTKLKKAPAWLVRQRKTDTRSDRPQWVKDGIGCEFGAEIKLSKPRKAKATA